MQRRSFLKFAAMSALAIPTSARADAAIYRDFQAGLNKHPELTAFTGVGQEALAAQASIEGAWPQDLRGVFYRNGPGRFERGGERVAHLFDGDGMVQAWHMDKGQVWHQARFVGTPKYREEAAADQLLYPGFGTAILRRPMINNDTLNTANTNVIYHANKLFALWEGGSANMLDPTTLAWQGHKTWRDDCRHLPFSAHPRIEADGTLWNFGAMPGANKLVLWHIRANGQLARVNLLEVADLCMVHDFAITERHLVFLLPPMRFIPQGGVSFLAQHHWQGDRPMRALIVDKADLSQKQMIELPPAMVFHLGNAFDDGEHIHLDACLYQDSSVLTRLGRHMRGEWPIAGSRADSVLISLDLRHGTSRQQGLLVNTEFPRVPDRQVGRRHHEVFVLSASSPDSHLNGLARIGLDNGKIERYELGPNASVEEHVLVVRPGGGHWLLGTSLDLARQQTVLQVFAAENLAVGPLAKARLPYAAPRCFHGNFYAKG